MTKSYSEQMQDELEPIPQKIVYSDDSSCVLHSGEMNDHPKVWFTIPKGGEDMCRYCEIKFRLRDNDADDF